MSSIARLYLFCGRSIFRISRSSIETFRTRGGLAFQSENCRFSEGLVLRCVIALSGRGYPSEMFRPLAGNGKDLFALELTSTSGRVSESRIVSIVETEGLGTSDASWIFDHSLWRHSLPANG